MQYQVVPQVVPPTVISLFVNLGWLSVFAFLKAARKVGALPIRGLRSRGSKYYYSGPAQTHIIITLSVVALVLAKECRCMLYKRSSFLHQHRTPTPTGRSKMIIGARAGCIFLHSPLTSLSVARHCSRNVGSEHPCGVTKMLVMLYESSLILSYCGCNWMDSALAPSLPSNFAESCSFSRR